MAVASGPAVWVSKWVDYSSKYGLGYLLCDGHIGVVFNDSTKIVLAEDGSQVEYIERRKVSGGSYDDKKSFQLAAHPQELTKKVTLLRHFKNYLLEHTPPGQEKPSSGSTSSGSTSGGAGAKGEVRPAPFASRSSPRARSIPDHVIASVRAIRSRAFSHARRRGGLTSA